MDLGVIEAYLQEALAAVVPAGVTVQAGPPTAGPGTGARGEIFVHAARYEDWNGTTADGARTARRRVGAKGSGGFVEERPGRLIVEVACVAGALKQVQQLAALVGPLVLLALERMPAPLLAASKTPPVTLRFDDFRVALHRCATSIQVDDRVAVHHGSLTFHLDGFLHVQVKQNVAPPPAVRRPAARPRSRTGPTPRRRKTTAPD